VAPRGIDEAMTRDRLVHFQCILEFPSLIRSAVLGFSHGALSSPGRRTYFKALRAGARTHA
jgi:hypothetical protein